MTLALRPYQERCLADLWHWFERDFALPKRQILLRNSGREGATNTRPALNIKPVVEAVMSDRPDTGNPSAIQEIISKAEARERGLTHYFTGKPCKHGHVAKRWANSSACVACDQSRDPVRKREGARRRYHQDPAKKASIYAWRGSNPEAFKASLKRYQAKHRDRIAVQRAEHYRANREEILRRDREYREANREQRREMTKRWRRENPEKARVASRNKKAVRRAAEGRHTASDIDAIRTAQKGRCAYCRTSLKTGEHVDHIIALAKGGTNWPSNLQLLCPPCNMAKHDKDPVDFAQERGFLL